MFFSGFVQSKYKTDKIWIIILFDYAMLLTIELKWSNSKLIASVFFCNDCNSHNIKSYETFIRLNTQYELFRLKIPFL